MEYKNMEDPEQRRKEIHRFYDLFLPAQKKYGLTASCRTSVKQGATLWQQKTCDIG